MLGGQEARLMNVVLPCNHRGDWLAHPIDGVCSVCGCLYAELITGTSSLCSECKLEHNARISRVLERRWGIDLGWGNRDPIAQRAIYGARDQVTHLGGLGRGADNYIRPAV